MDIQEINKLNKVSNINKLIEEPSIDSSVIRTMAKDMAGLKGERSFVSKATPPSGLPVLPITPLKPPISPKPKIPEIKIIGKRRKPAFISLVLAVVVIIGGIGGFFYWWNYVRLVPEIVIEEGIDEPIIDEPDEPSSFISVATTETIELIAGQENLLIGQLKALSVQEQEDNTFKQVLVKITDQTETKYADLSVLMIALGINIPEPITAAITQGLNNYTLFFYSQPEGNRLGLIVKIEGSETLVQNLKDWETTVLDDIKSMLLIDEIPFAATERFQDNIHKGVYIRYTNFATPDLSLDYGLVAGNLVLSTSRESMFATIDILLSE